MRADVDRLLDAQLEKAASEANRSRGGALRDLVRITYVDQRGTVGLHGERVGRRHFGYPRFEECKALLRTRSMARGGGCCGRDGLCLEHEQVPHSQQGVTTRRTSRKCARKSSHAASGLDCIDGLATPGQAVRVWQNSSSAR